MINVSFPGVSFFVVVSTVDLAGVLACDYGISFGREQIHHFFTAAMAQPPAGTTGACGAFMIFVIFCQFASGNGMDNAIIVMENPLVSIKFL